MTNTIVIRINYNTFKRIKAVFPSVKDESVSRYFQRLATWLEKKS